MGTWPSMQRLGACIQSGQAKSIVSMVWPDNWCVSSMGESTLNSHSKSEKHKQNSIWAQRYTIIFWDFWICVRGWLHIPSVSNWVEKKPLKNVICPWKSLEKKGLRSVWTMVTEGSLFQQDLVYEQLYYSEVRPRALHMLCMWVQSNQK